MIATDITGGSGNGDANQVFNLLAVVANPDVYAEKVRTLMEATEENKKFVALIGPANEILDLRDQAAKKLAEAKEVLDAARQEAEQLKVSAEAEKQKLVEDAKAEAAQITDEAKKLKAETKAANAAATAKARENEAALRAVKAQQDDLEAKIKKAEDQYEQNAADSEVIEANKQKLIAIHKRHLQELSE